MSNLRKIEKLTGGKATITQQPANDFFPAPHWFLQTADGGRFGATSKRDLLASIAEFLTEQAAQQSVQADGALCADCGKSPAMEGCTVCAECGL